MSDQESFLYIKGRKDAEIVVITEPPEEEPYNRNDVFTGEESRYFQSICAAYGFDHREFAYIPCATPMGSDIVTDSQQNKHLQLDYEEFHELLAECRPRLIVALGKHALRQLTGRAVQIGKARGKVHEHEGISAPVLPLTSVRQCLWFPENIPVFQSDFNMLAKLDENGFDMACLDVANESNTNYFWTMDLKELLARDNKWAAVDTETTGLEWWEDAVRVITVQITVRPGESFVVPLHPAAVKAVYPDMTDSQITKAIAAVKVQLRQILGDPDIRKIGANFKFDHHMLRKEGLHVRGWFADTQQLAFNVDENMFNKGLDEVVRRWVPEMSGYADAFNATVDKSKMLALLQSDPDKFLRYSGGDTDGNYRAAMTLMRIAANDKTNWQTYIRVQLPALIAFAERVEPQGLMVDRDRLGELQEQIAGETKDYHTRILSQIPAKIRRDHLRAGLSLTRQDLQRDALFSKDGLNLTPVEFTKGTRNLPMEERVPTTSAKTHLVYFAHEPLVEGIMRWSKLEKMRTTYVGKRHDEEKGGPTGFWKHLVPRGGNYWIHPSFFLHRTTTGRSASANPNAQNFPKRGDLAKSFRSIFIAPPGCKIVEADLSQAEIRVAGVQANEKKIIRLYREGVDIHLNTGCAVSGNDVRRMAELKKCKDPVLQYSNELSGVMDFLRKMPEHKRAEATVADFVAQLRYQAKAINFGFLYGMQWEGFKSYAKIEYGIEYTDAEAQRIRSDFFNEYPGLVDWHYASEREVYQNGEVRALHGAVRRLPSIYSTQRGIQREAVRQAINSPIQRFASDLGIMALWRLCRDAPEDLRPVAFIHDALVSYVPDAKAEEYGSNIRWYMENQMLEEWFGVKMPLPIIADVSIGDRQSAMEEVSVDANCPIWYDHAKDLKGRYYA